MATETTMKVPIDAEAQMKILSDLVETDPSPHNKLTLTRAMAQMIYYNEMRTMFGIHWASIKADSNNFFAMVYGQYLTSPGKKVDNELGVRGVTFLVWDTIEDMRANIRGLKGKATDKKTNVNYAPIQRIDPDSNTEMMRMLKEYDPTDSFVVCMWCHSPAYIDVKIVKRGQRPDVSSKEVLMVAGPPVMEADGTLSIKCARPECEVTSAKQKLGACGRCHISQYCSKTCLIADRPRHKAGCVAPTLPLP